MSMTSLSMSTRLLLSVVIIGYQFDLPVDDLRVDLGLVVGGIAGGTRCVSHLHDRYFYKVKYFHTLSSRDGFSSTVPNALQGPAARLTTFSFYSIL